MKSPPLLFSFAFLLVTIQISYSLKVDKSFTVTHFVKTFETFGLDKGGQINITATSQPISDYALILICTVRDFNIILNDLDGSCDIQQLTKITGCWRVKLNGNITIIDVPLRSLYNFAVFNCYKNFSSDSSRQTLIVHVTYELVNPEEGQLPVGSGPIPLVYTCLAYSWGAMLFLWFINALKFRQFFTRVHTLLSLVMFFKFSVVMVSLSYWRIYQLEGIRLSFIDYLRNLLYALSETFFFCVLLLIAKGWCVTRRTLPLNEIRSFAMGLLLLLAILIFFTFYNEEYYFLSLTIMYFFMLPRIFTALTYSAQNLETQYRLLETARVNVDLRSYQHKVKTFKILKTLVMLYIGAVLIVSSVRFVLMWVVTWVNIPAAEGVTFFVILAVCWLLRPCENGIFTLNVETLRPLTRLQQLLERYQLFQNRDLNEFMHNRDEAWDISNTLLVEWPNDKLPTQYPSQLPLSLCIAERNPQQIKDETS